MGAGLKHDPFHYGVEVFNLIVFWLSAAVSGSGEGSFQETFNLKPKGISRVSLCLGS